MRAERSIRVGWILLLSLAALPQPAGAETPVDTITVKDGSVLRGEIKRVEDDELVLDTDYADDVIIDVEYIVGIKSTQQFSVRLVTGEIISGFLVVSDGKIVLRESLPPPGEAKAEAPEQVDLADTTGEARPATPPPGAEELALGATPSAAERPQPAVTAADEEPRQAILEQLDRDEAKAEIAAASGMAPPEAPPAIEPPAGRKFTFHDVDWIREKPTYLRYDADFNTAVELARGNSDTTDLHFDARFEPSFGWNTLRFSGEYDKKTADGDTTTNRWRAIASYERDFFRRWFVGAANSYESDRQKDLDLRIIAGAGVGYRFYDEDPTHLSVLPALAYVNENFKEVVDANGMKSSDDANYVAFQFKTDFKRDLYKDDITIYHSNMYLNSLQHLSDIIIETRTGITFDMPWDFVLSAEFQSDWENEPAEDAKKLDTRYMLKIGFEFEGDESDWFQ